MAEPVFRLATPVDIRSIQGQLEPQDLETVARLEQVFGRESFTLPEALDIVNSSDAIRRLRSIRLIASAEQ